MKLILTLALILISIAAIVPAQTQPRRLVANLRDNSVADGCGCYFQFRSTPENHQQYIFASAMDEDETAWMNIDGRDVKLKLQKETGPKIERVGSRSTVKYRAGDISVNGRYVATKVCDPNDEDCESTSYNAIFLVRKGTRSEVVKAKGFCGC